MNRKPKRVYIFLLCIFILGAFIRVLGGTTLFHSTLIYSSGKKGRLPGKKTPEGIVKSFYMFIDHGDYDKAWEISLEPVWGKTGGAFTYRDEVREDPKKFSGWTDKSAFVTRLMKSLGDRGSGIKLNQIVTYTSEKLDEDEMIWIKSRYNSIEFDKAYSVQVGGQILGACSIFKWEKDVIVLGIDGTYKVLLDGTKPKNSFFYQSWFSNIKRVENLKGSSS